MTRHFRTQVKIQGGQIVVDGMGNPVYEQVEVPIDWTPDMLLRELKQRRDTEWLKGALLPTGLRLQTDSESVTNLQGAISAGIAITAMQQPFSITWSLGGGQFVELDLATLQQLGLLQFQHIQTVQSRYAVLYQLISPESSAEDLRSVADQFETGWPA